MFGWVTAGIAAVSLAAWKLISSSSTSKPTDAPPPPPPATVDPTPPGFDVFGVPFAAGAVDPTWPILADRRSATPVKQWARGMVTTDFGDARPFGSKAPTRHHAGEDLRAPRGAELVATEGGNIVSIDESWYDSASGVPTGSVLLATDTGIVLNYGEVEPHSTTALGLNVGSRVERGQVLATVGATNMVHFETYEAGTKLSHRWPWHGPPPTSLRDPTRYLQRAAKTVPA